MRRDAGLLLPDRRIGLSAHDFQQAAAGAKVWLTRAERSEDAETVPSRWVNRLTNLLHGLPTVNGPQILEAMRSRGRIWTSRAAILDESLRTTPSPRPSPRPPAAARPKKLSVTEIQTLIRDPYAIYARHVLRLRKLNPLVPEPDALSRGVVLHSILEEFVKYSLRDPASLSRKALIGTARDILVRDIPWPVAQRMWLARIERFADWFVEQEIQRQISAVPLDFEASMAARIDALGFELHGKADRIDRGKDGQVFLYDYKTSRAPTDTEQRHFDKQLLLEAAIVEQAGFQNAPPAPVSAAVFIGLGKHAEVPAPLDDQPTAVVWSELKDLIRAYLDETQGFTSRRMPHKDRDDGEYDHLARYGEWDATVDPSPEDLT